MHTGYLEQNEASRGYGADETGAYEERRKEERRSSCEME